MIYPPSAVTVLGELYRRKTYFFGLLQQSDLYVNWIALHHKEMITVVYNGYVTYPGGFFTPVFRVI